MSPFIHKELFALKNISAEYGKSEIVPDNLKREYETELRALDGFNITIPHKVAIISLLDEIDSLAAEYGAVNTVARREGKYIGYNTDAHGFLKGLEFSGIPLSGKVLVYGCGGAARSVISECLKAGCEVTVGTTADRIEKTEKTVSEIETKTGCSVSVISNENISENYDVFINTTPIGMYPKTGVSPIDEKQLEHFRYVYDLVYNPEETELLRLARENGKICGGGLSMLVCQAEQAHNIWYGAEFSNEETNEVIRKCAEEMKRVFKRKNILLCGFMGSGKTSAGKLLAKKLGYAFVDTDEFIINKCKMSIPEIFDKYGEEYFRVIENETLKELSDRDGTVIALGGGLAANKINHPYLKKLGYVILLDCGIEETLLRISGDKNRPLTAGGVDDIIDRYNFRKPIYESVADAVVDSGKTPEKTSENLLKILEQLK